MQKKEFTGTAEATTGTMLILLLFGFAALPFSSCCSFAFHSPSSALIVMIAFHFVTGFGLVITNFILTAIGGGTAVANKSLQPFFQLFPAYNLGKGFYTLSTRKAFDTLGIE